MTTELMRLRVPQGWTVSFNRFLEFTDGYDFGDLTEDLLQMSAGPDSYTIDLGWYPDSDPGGRYGLTVVLPDFSGEQIVRVDHRDQYVIRDALEACAAVVTRRGSAEQIAIAARTAVSR